MKEFQSMAKTVLNALLELAPRILIDVDYDPEENAYVWTVVKHPERELRGDKLEYKV
ncbi:MAG: hypothetical protein P1Q69_04560 [Candidatus Thorarchaeota archaeon]|nr:hypothetical protein [Candidatus Thorarchaeota archaeon]